MKAIVTIGETNQTWEIEDPSLCSVVTRIESHMPEYESDCPEGQDVSIAFYDNQGELIDIDY
jgi:hypothetical protein